MKKLIILMLCAAWFLLAHAQPAGNASVPAATAPSAGMKQDAERSRIHAERAHLESGFAAEEAACYRKFLTSNCLDKVKLRSREVMADLRRQEISLDEQERKARAAAQTQKTEEKSSPLKQQEAADRRAAALDDFEARMAREKEKSAGREAAQSNEKANTDATAGRIKGHQEKAVGRIAKGTAAAEEVRKYNERLEKAKERQERRDREQAAQIKPGAMSLPQPD